MNAPDEAVQVNWLLHCLGCPDLVRLFDRIIACRDNDYRDLGKFAIGKAHLCFAELFATHTRQIQIENHQRRTMLFESRQPLGAVVRGDYGEAVIPQGLCDDLAEVRVVFDDEDAVAIELRERNDQCWFVIVYRLGPTFSE